MGPDILHIGFSKCGSSSLRNALKRAKNVNLVFKSEFFNPLFEGAINKDEYLSLFECGHEGLNIESDEHMVLPGVHPELGVRTTNLDSLVRVFDKIKDNLPNARILLIVRNQADLIVSRYCEYIYTGGKESLDEFVPLLFDGSDNKYYQNYYNKILTMLTNRFDESKVLILTQEQLREEKSISKLKTFIGINDLNFDHNEIFGRISLSKNSIKMLSAFNRRAVLQVPHYKNIGKKRIPHWLYGYLVKGLRLLDFVLVRLKIFNGRVELSLEAQRRIKEHFHQDNLAFQESMQLDLTACGYLLHRSLKIE